MAKYIGRFTRIEEYEVEADTLDEAIDILEDLVTFDYDDCEYFDEEGHWIAYSY